MARRQSRPRPASRPPPAGPQPRQPQRLRRVRRPARRRFRARPKRAPDALPDPPTRSTRRRRWPPVPANSESRRRSSTRSRPRRSIRGDDGHSRGGVSPKDCHLVPDRFLDALQREATRHGATFRWDTEVQGWKSPRPRRGPPHQPGDFQADDYVLCGGAWSPGVARGLGLRLPMQAGKGYSLTVPNPRQLPAICSILTEARVAVTPMGSSLVRGDDGNRRPERGDQSAPDSGDRRGRQPLCPTPAQDFAGIQPWRGLRPVSPDGLPYLGRSRSRTSSSPPATPCSG